MLKFSDRFSKVIQTSRSFFIQAGRWRGGQILLLSFIFSIFVTCSSCTGERKKPRPKPNFILIVTDDQDSNSLQLMRKMHERLRARSITFTHAFVSSPVCGPSRGSILTGKFPSTTGITRRYHEMKGDNEQETLATLLKRAGYMSGMVGKYMNGYRRHSTYIPVGWDHWYSIIDENTYYNYRLNENGEIVTYGEAPDEYITAVLSSKAQQFLRSTSADVPFFLYIGTVAPHVPVTVEEKYKDHFSDVQVEFSFEKDITDKPAWVQKNASANAELVKSYFGNADYMEELYRKRWRTLLSVDDMIEKLCDTLEAQGKLDNTYILLVSDNGDGVSDHIPISPKLTPYDDGIRVPFYISGPAIKEQRKEDSLISTVDILPTFAELAEIEPFTDAEGISFAPTLSSTSESDQARKAIFAELTYMGERWPWKSTPPSYKLIRTAEYKYIEYQSGEREYYDLVNDPDEMENIYTQLDTKRQEYIHKQLLNFQAKQGAE